MAKVSRKCPGPKGKSKRRYAIQYTFIILTGSATPRDDCGQAGTGVVRGARKPSRAGFLPKLYAVVNNPRYQDIIHWDQSGTIIVVQDAHRLSTEVCPVIYDQKDSTSFFRQMNIWNWSRIDDKTAPKGSLGTRSSSWTHPEGLNKWSTPDDLAAITRRVKPRVVSKTRVAKKVPPSFPSFPSFPDYFEMEDDDVELAPPSPLLASYLHPTPFLTPSSTASSTPAITPATTPAASPSPIFQTRPFGHGQIPGVHGQFFFQGSPLVNSSSYRNSYGGDWSLPQTPHASFQTPLRPSQLRQSFGCLPPVDLHQLGLADGVTAAEVEGLAAAAIWPDDGFF